MSAYAIYFFAESPRAAGATPSGTAVGLLVSNPGNAAPAGVPNIPASPPNQFNVLDAVAIFFDVSATCAASALLPLALKASDRNIPTLT